MSNRSLIIVPVDSSEETERAVQYAVSIARQRDADVHAIQVVPRDGALWLAPENETRLRARLRALRPAAEQEGVLVRGGTPRTWVDEAVSGSTLRAVLQRATAPVRVLPVVGGAHEWIDEVERNSARIRSTADAMARRAA